jgi:capsular polysaccharide biosynthesis protein
MDLIGYVRVVGRWWPVALLGLAMTVALTALFIDQQPLVYRSAGTMVVRPRTVDTGESVRAIDALTRGAEISSTYATVARSDLIRQRAAAELGPDFDASGMSVSSEVVTSTSILEVSVTGGNPEAVSALAAEVTRQTVSYVAELQNVFELQIIDEPQVPTSPIAPKRTLLLATGVVLGVAVGVVLALLAEMVSRPAFTRRQYAPSQLERHGWSRRLAEDGSGSEPGHDRARPPGHERASERAHPETPGVTGTRSAAPTEARRGG